jgi:hypothetical protein
MTVTKTRYPAGFYNQRDERGEGVISAAIAVLVMAFLGVAMWFAFSVTFNHAANHVDNQVNCIGQTSSNC